MRWATITYVRTLSSEVVQTDVTRITSKAFVEPDCVIEGKHCRVNWCGSEYECHVLYISEDKVVADRQDLCFRKKVSSGNNLVHLCAGGVIYFKSVICYLLVVLYFNC